MTRYINLCRNAVKRVDDKPIEETPPPTKYEQYKDAAVFYNNTDKRKEFMREYNRNYRLQHSNLIECECGVVYKDISKYAHNRSKRHLTHIEKKNKGEV